MRHGAIVLSILILLGGLSSVSAQSETKSIQGLELDWEYDFGNTFISTKPLIVNETIFVRTSTSTANSDPAGIYAFDLDGELLWSKLNYNPISNDMSPITYVEQGQGDCGAWSNMLIIGWANGTIEALHPGSGAIFWQQSTEVLTWGITGSLLVDLDNLLVPTRTGLANYCLSNGSINFEIETGIGWRNGVSKSGENYFLGDETGTLWKVSKHGNITSKFLDIGKIRHAPLAVGEKLLVHGQGMGESTIVLVDPADLTLEIISKSGPSPGIPLKLNDTVITIDSSFVKRFDCSITCQFIDQYPFTSNGESSSVFGDMLMMPKNTVEGGWGLFSLNNSTELVFNELFSTRFDWYGTSAPAYHSVGDRQILAFGNDNGNLQVFSMSSEKTISQQPVETIENSYLSQVLTLVLFIFLATSGIQFLRGNYKSSFRFLIVILVVIFTFAFNDIATAWSSYISELNDETKSTEELWDDDWPEEWLGTQIIILEFDNQTLVSGGHVNNDYALELTYQASESLSVSVEDTDTSIGKYIESFNGVQGEGWIFFVDGSEAMISAEYAEINSDSIVHWKII